MRVRFLWIMLLPIGGLAQENTSGQTPDRPPYIIKTAPFNLVNPVQQSVDVLADIPLSPRWGLEMGVSLVTNSESLAQYTGESYRGVKLKPAIKYYTARSASADNYIGLAFKYNSIHNDRYVNVVRQGGQYSEWMLQRKRLEVWGAAFRLGSQRYLGSRKRWMIEPFIGLGVRRLRVSRDALPPDADVLEESRLFSLDREPGTYVTPDWMMGVGLGWVLPGRR